MKNKTPISTLGKVAFTEQLLSNSGVVRDDCSVIERDEFYELVSCASMFEGIDFDLTYFPLQHLGYKSVVKAVSNVCAMNGKAERLYVNIGLSTRFAVEDVELLYSGIYKACQDYGVILHGGDTSASLTGLIISMTCIGSVEKSKITRRKGANKSDILCLSGSLGAAYLGLQVLEREKRALSGNEGVAPSLQGYEYVLGKQLKPIAPISVVNAIAAGDVVPTAMIDITKGLSSAVLNLCHSAELGARVMLDRLPIAREVFKCADEFGIDPVVAALNGGDDFELLFTVPATLHKDVLAFAEVIGYMTDIDDGARLVSADGSELTIMSPDFTAQE